MNKSHIDTMNPLHASQTQGEKKEEEIQDEIAQYCCCCYCFYYFVIEIFSAL